MGERNYTILVIDDDREIRETLSEILVEEGFQVASAKNGQDGLNYLLTAPAPNLILLDLSMPVMDGAEFCQEMLKHPKLAGIPVIAFSAVSAIEARIKGLPIVGYLKKPIQLDELLEALAKFCDR